MAKTASKRRVRTTVMNQMASVTVPMVNAIVPLVSEA